jgi:hypothetical protein
MSSSSTQKWKCPACGATHDSPFASCPDCGSPKVGTPFYYCDIHGDLTGSVCSSCLRAEKRADKLACAKREAMAGGDWCHALALCDELDAERPGDPDVASVRRKAQAEGARIEREERKEAARRVAEAERLAREERERLACEEEARRQAARIKARWRKRIIFLALGLLIWVVVFWGIPAKRKADYRNALHAKDYAEVARICKKLAPKWRPAVNYLEYWGARQALEAALKEADPVVYRKAGGETWAEMETQKQLGEECVLYSYRYLEGKAAYVAALATINEITARVDPNWGKYVGEYKDGKYDGQGEITFPDGKQYVGQFKDGKYNGQGTMTSWNGQKKYVGEFKDGMPNGNGTLVSPDGAKYVGEFKNDQYNGQGTLTFPDGLKYIGGFTNGKERGHGTLSFPNGQTYVGEFENGQYSGQGTLTIPGGMTYFGEWKSGRENGQGTSTFSSGAKYVGELKNGFYDGHGAYFYLDGSVYVGDFKGGKRHGRGKLVGRNGAIIQEGMWRNDAHIRTTAHAK